jgi:hypothetical protein
MPFALFLRQLLIVAVGCAALLGLVLWCAPATRAHTGFAGATLLLFVLLSLALYFWARRAAGSERPQAFSGVVTASVFGKMVFSLAFLAVYQKTMMPSNTWFVGIFLLTYTIFTAFEVHYMTKLGQ